MRPDSSPTRDGEPLRVFISHTAELRMFPRRQSYVSEVERAIMAAGHVVVDMADFPATDRPPADLCEDKVHGCQVYIGLLGTRYGSPVRDKPEMSYTELEFDTATAAGLDRLVFMLDPDAENVGIPASQLMDREFGERQDAFRRRVRDSGLTTQSFSDPAKLGQLVERSLREVADTRRRVSSGIQREQIPADDQPTRATKFVNPPPAIAPTWFRGRQFESELLAKYVIDPGIRMVTVVGRGGIGKTAMVCRLLKGWEAGRVPGLAGDQDRTAVGGIVYLSPNGVHPVQYPTLVKDLLRLVPPEAAERLRRRHQDPRHNPRTMMLDLMEAFPVGDPVVVLLDNIESIMDAERESLLEPALHEALTAVLTAPAHAVTVIATTRVTPTSLLKTEPARQRQLRLDAGLGSPDAETVLRALDDDGHLGLRDADDDVLDGLRRHTRGVPRALEAVKAILDADGTLTPHDLLDRTRLLPEDQVVQVLVGEAYELLDPAAQQVMQALSVYPMPVSAVAVDFLLRPVHPTINAAPILARLVRRQLVRFIEGHYHLHPLDREYASGLLPTGSADGTGAEFTLSALRGRAADYYARVRTPRESWRGLDDVRPQLAEFELRCDTGDYDTAAIVLADVDFDCLQVWGHYRMLVALHARIRGRISDPPLNSTSLTNLGLCHYSLGNYHQAVDLHTEALTIDREIGNRHGEAADLGNLGICQYRLGNYQRAIDLHTQGLTIHREIRSRDGEAGSLGNLGICQFIVGNYHQAVDLYTQALAIAREIGRREREGNQLCNLGLCELGLGNYRQAVDLFSEALIVDRETGNRDGESADLAGIGICRHCLGDYGQAIDLHTRALAIAREIGSRYGEASSLASLGASLLASGDVHRAVTVLDEAILVADRTGDVEPAATARAWLARAHVLAGDPVAALAATAAARDIPYPIELPTLRLLEGLALLDLRRVDQAAKILIESVTAADALLALADRNVDALQAKALALSGLAAATGDPARSAQATEAFAHADAVTTAPGVVADTRALLNLIDGPRP